MNVGIAVAIEFEGPLSVAPKPGATWAVGAQGAAKLLASRW